MSSTMNRNQGKTLSLMDELANAGFGQAKIESPSSSQDDFTSTLYTDPVIKLNFSDVDDITSFNEKNLQASTPLVTTNSVHTECDDVTMDSDLLKGYTQKIQCPTTSFQENMLVSHSDGANRSSHGGIGLNLEQELQQATSQNAKVDISHNECPVKSELDISKNSVSLCNNVGLSLEQELQQATSQNGKADISHNECSVKSELDISKNSVSLCNNVGLSLEQELQQATSQNSKADISHNECPVKSDLDISKNSELATSQNDQVEANNKDTMKIDLDINKNLMSLHNNIDLDLEQKLQEAISQNGNASSIDNSSLKTDLYTSKDEIPLIDDVVIALKLQNESFNQPEVFTEIKEMVPVDKDLFKLENNEMEISISGEAQNMKLELELAGPTSFNNEIEEKEIFDNDGNVPEQNCISPEFSQETSRYITKNDSTSVKNNNGNSSDVLNTLEYLGFDDERLKSSSDSNTSIKATISPVRPRESNDEECANDISVANGDVSVSVRNKRSSKMERCLSSKTDVSPEKKTKIDSGNNLNGSISKTRSPDICLKQNELPKGDYLTLESLGSGLNKESSDEQLKKKIEILEKQLENEQQLTTQAAELGMQVLQENHDLKDKVDDLLRKIATTEEERENERHAAKLKLQNKDYMEQQYNEEISHLKEEISKVKESLESAEKAETTLTRQLKSLEYSAEQFQLKEQQLTTTIEHLEQLLKEKVEQAHHNASVNFNQMDNSHVEQITTLQQEILELQNNNTLLKSQLISHEANIKRLGEEITLCQQSKESKEQEIDEMKYEMNSYHKTLEVAQTEILDLKAQLHAAQIENVSHKDRGNSLFSEIEDRRVLAEKTVATLQRNYQALKERYDVEKQQHHKLKMQAVSLLHMNSGKVSDEYVKQLNSMLQQAKNEAKELQEKVKNYQKNEAQQTEKMVKIQNTFGTNENRDFIEFLKSLNDIKQKELDEVKEKLNDMEMQYLQETTKVVDYIKKVHLIEEEARSLRCNNMKLKLRNEELMMKYNPDELSEGKSMPKTCVEKIPLGPTENIAQSLMKQKTKHKIQSKVSPENETKPRAQQIAELVRCGAINPANVLKESPRAKKKAVSMASEVTIIDNDGKEEKKVNLVDENIPVKLEKRRPQGKFAPADKIIEVKSPVHGRADCKQQ